MIFALIAVFFVHSIVFFVRYLKYRKLRDLMLVFTFSFLTIAYVFVATDTTLIINLSLIELRMRDILRIAAALCTVSSITLLLVEKARNHVTKQM